MVKPPRSSQSYLRYGAWYGVRIGPGPVSVCVLSTGKYTSIRRRTSTPIPIAVATTIRSSHVDELARGELKEEEEEQEQEEEREEIIAYL